MVKHRKSTIYRSDDKSESFASLPSFHHTSLKDKISALRVINELSSNVLEGHLQSLKEEMDQKVAKLPKKAKSEYDSIGMEIIALSGSIETDDLNIDDHLVAKIMEEETKMYNHREHIRRSSKEMILIYLIIIFEEFLANLLSSLFRKRPEILKSQKTITYQEAFQHVDLYDLLKTLSKREAGSATDLDIDKLGEYLSTKFKLSLNQRRDWDQFKEFFYRRNVIVHNYGYPDSIYIAKIKLKVDENEWLEIDNISSKGI